MSDDLYARLRRTENDLAIATGKLDAVTERCRRLQDALERIAQIDSMPAAAAIAMHALKGD